MSEDRCILFWGSHGCSLLEGHEGPHLCGSPGDFCSEFRETGPPSPEGFRNGLLWPGECRYAYDDDGNEWSEWSTHYGAFK